MKLFNKYILLFSLGIVALMLLFTFTVNKVTTDETSIKIGVGDDISGLLLNYTINVKGLKVATSTENSFEAFPIKDCCTSTAQLALSSDLLDVAIICPSAAATLIEKDNRFEIVGPCVVNSDIFVIKEDKLPQKIGVTQNRVYQHELIREKFGQKIEIVPMITTALPFALERDLVDGIVIDIIRGLALEGEKMTTGFNQDIVSYVLVVRKSFKDDDRYLEFLRLLQESVNELNDAIKSEDKEVEMWHKLKTRFLTPRKV